VRSLKVSLWNVFGTFDPSFNSERAVQPSKICETVATLLRDKSDIVWTLEHPENT
jgi:hypothetical protein